MDDKITIEECISRLDVIRHEIVPNSRDYFALSAGISALLNMTSRTMTNADRIRQMTDEELAEFIDKATDCCSDGWTCDKCPMYDADCAKIEGFIAWLKQKVQDDDRKASEAWCENCDHIEMKNWIDAREQCGSFVCKKCKYQSKAQYKFCPECGLDMRDD